MYECFGIVYGWNLSKEKARWLIEEGVFDHLEGECPYSGGGESTTYIGVNIYGIDCSIVSKGLTLDTFNNTIQNSTKTGLTSSKCAKNLKKWRADILAELKKCLVNGEINQKDHDNFKAVIDKRPTLFWTWSTS